VVPAAPGIFSASGDPRGTPVVVHASDFSLVTRENPANPGEYLAVFCTGLGATNPTAISGQPAAEAATLQNNIYGTFDSGAQILTSYAGLAPGFIGLDQVNFQVSPTELPGLTHLRFSVGAYVSNQVMVWIANTSSK